MTVTTQLGHAAGSNSWRPVMWGAIASLLLLPPAAMQFTDEVQWTGYDFAVAALLLVGAGALFELAACFVRDRGQRRLIAAGLFVIVFVIWLDGAAGIF